MKLSFITLFFILFVSQIKQSTAQVLQIAKVTEAGQELNTVNRFAWRIPITDIFYEREKILLHGGLIFKNEGFIFDRGMDRFKRRTLTAGPELNVGLIFSEEFIVTIGYGFDLNLHYKEKIFPDQVRKDKITVISIWGSGKAQMWNHCARIGIGNQEVYFFGEYYLSSFFETSALNVTRFNIGLSWMRTRSED